VAFLIVYMNLTFQKTPPPVKNRLARALKPGVMFDYSFSSLNILCLSVISQVIPKWSVS
jgi:hypothetical protein